MLELHCHTTCSDGQLSPAELVQAAVSMGVRALAITDHDTMQGWGAAQTAAVGTVLEIVPGVELSTTWNGRSLHILGFYPDPERLRAPLAQRQAGRWQRARQIAQKLAELGYPIEFPDLGDTAPGRMHLAAALVAAGHVTSKPEAFKRFLGDDGPAYVSYDPLSSVDGIALLRDCGAVPVWAHPYRFRGGDVETVLAALLPAGLMGLEVYHPHHRPTEVAHLTELCDRYGLLRTGGSDFHAPLQRHPGTTDYAPLNSLQLPLSLLTPLQAAARSLW